MVFGLAKIAEEQNEQKRFTAPGVIGGLGLGSIGGLAGALAGEHYGEIAGKRVADQPAQKRVTNELNAHYTGAIDQAQQAKREGVPQAERSIEKLSPHYEDAIRRRDLAETGLNEIDNHYRERMGYNDLFMRNLDDHQKETIKKEHNNVKSKGEQLYGQYRTKASDLGNQIRNHQKQIGYLNNLPGSLETDWTSRLNNITSEPRYDHLINTGRKLGGTVGLRTGAALGTIGLGAAGLGLGNSFGNRNKEANYIRPLFEKKANLKHS